MSAQEIDHRDTPAPGQAEPASEPAPAPTPALPAQPVRRKGLWRSLPLRISGLATGLLVVAGVGILILSQPEPQPAPAAPAAAAAPVARPPSISVVPARTGSITETAVVTGNLVPREEILVAAQIDGYAIEEILVEEGDSVERGQVLARLSRAMIEAGLAQSAAQIARADAAIAQAKSSIAEAEATQEQTASALARSQALRQSGNTTEASLEVAQSAARQAAARLRLAQNALAVAEADKRLAEAQQREWQIREQRSEIKAPVAGVVSRRTARIGAIAASTGEPLFRIIADGEIELAADVPEATLARLAAGMAARVKTAARAEPYAGRIRLVTPEVDPTTRLGRVRIAIEKAPGLTIGAFGRATVEVETREGVLLPQSAILYVESGPTVQVVADGVVATRPVTIGLRTEAFAEIDTGVAAGDQVVSVAGTFVRDGDRVTPVPVKSE
jgi:RND family efflux transporter MFP subunit